MADVTDTEGILFGCFARVDNESLFFQGGVEAVEAVGRILRAMESGDDGRLVRGGQQGPKA